MSCLAASEIIYAVAGTELLILKNTYMYEKIDYLLFACSGLGSRSYCCFS